jgi:hypothetical protein
MDDKKIIKIIKDHFEFRNTDITNVVNIYDDIYGYKVVHISEPTAERVNYSVIKIDKNGEVHNIPTEYQSALMALLNSSSKSNNDKNNNVKKELEHKITFLENQIKILKNKLKISSLVFDYLDLDELNRQKFNKIIEKLSNLNKSDELSF